MTLNNQIYEQIRKILYNKYSYPLEQYEPQLRYQVELAVDSLEMYELLEEFEETFNIKFDPDDIDHYIFQPQDILYINDIKLITIQESVDYIEKKLQPSSLLKIN